jgi:hypothetical protein
LFLHKTDIPMRLCGAATNITQGLLTTMFVPIKHHPAKLMNPRLFQYVFPGWFLAASQLFVSHASAQPVDTIVLGDARSENAHALVAERSDAIKGGLDLPARRLLPLTPSDWQGGKVAFKMNVDPAQPNYFTVKLWGSDLTSNRLILFCEGKQVGYRHLGDIDILDIGDNAAAYAGRFFYNTSPLPLEMTKGRTELHFEIRGNGPIWGYGTNWEQYQHPMKEPSRGIYAAYTHTDGCFVPPAAEKQGEAPANPPVRKVPGEEVLAQVKGRLTRELNGMLKSKKPLGQEQMHLLAQAWHVKWTPAFQNKDAVQQIIKGADQFFRNFRKDPKVAEADPRTPNPDWFGLGVLGDAIQLLREPLQPFVDEKIDDGAGKTIARREAWTEMLVASREHHRHNRRQYTNQSMITDMNLYRANRGVAALTPSRALPEEQARRYLYEAVGLVPWLGSDTDSGPKKPLGDDYFQLTAKGLTKELGFVGYYGEVLDWVTQIYNATCEPGKPGTGDPKIKEQLARMEQARGIFRYPLPDADGNRAMRAETIVGWRDTHFPGDVTYGERAGKQGSAIFSASATLDPHSIGFAQQMFADNQFFNTVDELLKTGGIMYSKTLLGVPEQYEILKTQPPSRYRLPMTPGQPDFAWADEEDGVLAVKHGDEILYASLYWRARHAINNLARVHYITPRFDRIAVVREETQFEPGGMEYKRPDWVNMGFANGGLRYPGNMHSAHVGEKLPIAKIPAGIAFKPGQENVDAGRGSFYQLRYGPFFIGMNMTKDKTFELKAPPGVSAAPELISGKSVPLSAPLKVGPRSTAILYLGQ